MKYVIARTDGSLDVLERTAPIKISELRELIGGDVAEFILAREFEAYGPNKDLVAVPHEHGGFSFYKGIVNEDAGLTDLPENPFYPDVAGNVVIGTADGHVFDGATFMGLSDEGAQRAMQCLTAKR
jgi:hypothetical protein